MNTLKILSAVVLICSAMVMNSITYANGRTTGRGNGPVIFVTSQGLYYDSIVVADPLRQKGNFQQLVPDIYGLQTEFGPGDVGHLGGRWWVDLNKNGEMDDEDHFSLCPLPGPGRDHL